MVKRIDLQHVQHLVLDETDRLLEHDETGFVSQVDAIMAACSNPKLVGITGLSCCYYGHVRKEQKSELAFCPRLQQ